MWHTPHAWIFTTTSFGPGERELVVDAALAVMQVGVAHPARLDLHHDLVRAGIGNGDRLDGDGCALALGDDGADLLRHVFLH
ncbi:hypothetical protein ASG84_04805 [Rhodococcus sp. Leaf278]|nr:hypothetical protein ASG84_04805 [Rhodococcus sp. Leaf278]